MVAAAVDRVALGVQKAPSPGFRPISVFDLAIHYRYPDDSPSSFSCGGYDYLAALVWDTDII